MASTIVGASNPTVKKFCPLLEFCKVLYILSPVYPDTETMTMATKKVSKKKVVKKKAKKKAAKKKR